MIKLGMTAREVANIVGIPYEIFIDQWNRDTGPYMDWKQWVYKSELPITETEHAITDSYLYFDEDSKLSGWDISYDHMINVSYSTLITAPDDYQVRLGDTVDLVAAGYGAPRKLVPEGWGNMPDAPEVWEYRDEYNNPRVIINFESGIVTEIILQDKKG